MIATARRPLARAWARHDEAERPAPAEAPLGGAPPPAGAVIALNRMGFGPRPGDIAAFNALGSTDAQRLSNYVAQQLWPGPDDQDTVYWQRRTGVAPFPNPGFTTLHKSLT